MGTDKPNTVTVNICPTVPRHLGRGRENIVADGDLFPILTSPDIFVFSGGREDWRQRRWGLRSDFLLGSWISHSNWR